MWVLQALCSFNNSSGRPSYSASMEDTTLCARKVFFLVFFSNLCLVLRTELAPWRTERAGTASLWQGEGSGQQDSYTVQAGFEGCWRAEEEATDQWAYPKQEEERAVMERQRGRGGMGEERKRLLRAREEKPVSTLQRPGNWQMFKAKSLNTEVKSPTLVAVKV